MAWLLAILNASLRVVFQNYQLPFPLLKIALSMYSLDCGIWTEQPRLATSLGVKVLGGCELTRSTVSTGASCVTDERERYLVVTTVPITDTKQCC